MKTNPTTHLTSKQELALVKEIYDNFPEASVCLSCTSWKYDRFEFHFTDEDGKNYVVQKEDAIRGLRLFVAALYRGELRGLGLKPGYLKDTGEWDSFAFDALNQMAIYGEVIYG